jgi:hypothetical protein
MEAAGLGFAAASMAELCLRWAPGIVAYETHKTTGKRKSYDKEMLTTFILDEKE